jgi:hypothetical protein
VPTWNLRGERQAERVREVAAFLNAAPHKGNNPEIFTYQFVEHDGHALMRLHFYGNTRVSVVFIPG